MASVWTEQSTVCTEVKESNWILTLNKMWRRGGFVVSALASEFGYPGSKPWPGTKLSHPGVNMGTDEFNAGR